MGDTKQCTKCFLTKNVEEFYNSKSKKSGYETSCKTCTKKAVQSYKTKNPDKIREYISKNQESIKRRRKKYYADNAEASKAHYRAWYQDNKEHISAYDKEYKRENKEQVNIWNQRRRSRKEGLLDTFTKEEWAQCLEHFNNECVYCGSEERLTHDHFIPISKGGAYVKENIVPACVSCNSSKGNKPYQEWKRVREGISVKQEISIYVYFISLYEGGEVNSIR